MPLHLSQIFGLGIEIGNDGILSCISADRKNAFVAPRQQILSGKPGTCGNPVHLQLQLLEFSIQGRAILCRIGTASRLKSQGAHALHQVYRLIERTIGHIDDRDPIIGIADRRVGSVHFTGKTIADLQAGCIIGGTVDTQPG